MTARELRLYRIVVSTIVEAFDEDDAAREISSEFSDITIESITLIPNDDNTEKR